MASILDAGLASVFTSIFIFLIVYAIVYGVLTWKQMFGKDGRPMAMIVAFVIAMISAISGPAKLFITFIAPWYVALFMGIFFILFIISMFGVSPEKQFPKIIQDPRVYSWIIIFAVIIFIMGLGLTFGPGLTPGGSGVTAEQAIQNPSLAVIGNAQPGQLAPNPTVGGVGGTSQAGQPGSTSTSNFSTNVINTIFHPKILGMIVTFLIASITVFFLAGAPPGRAS